MLNCHGKKPSFLRMSEAPGAFVFHTYWVITIPVNKYGNLPDVRSG